MATNSILFLDIETVPEYYHWNDAPKEVQDLWAEKFRWQLQQNPDLTAEDIYNDKAGTLAEFSKIICISLAFLLYENGTYKAKVKSFYGDNEEKILLEIKALLDSQALKTYLLCAHNGKEFDFPFIARRMLIKGIVLPHHVDISGKKPWEVPHLDTMEMWRFGDYKNFTSIKLLAHVFNIPTPKDDISGADVKHVYYQENDLKRIVEYCEKDTITVARLYLKMKALGELTPENISKVEH